MLDVVIPVVLSFFLGPGAGQLYNREFRKGTYLILLSLLVFTAAAFWVRQAAMPYMPPNFIELMADRLAFQKVMEEAMKHIVTDHAGTFYVYQVLLMGTWMYGVVDAYRGGLRRRWQKRMPPTTTFKPS